VCTTEFLSGGTPSTGWCDKLQSDTRNSPGGEELLLGKLTTQNGDWSKNEGDLHKELKENRGGKIQQFHGGPLRVTPCRMKLVVQSTHTRHRKGFDDRGEDCMELKKRTHKKNHT